MPVIARFYGVIKMYFSQSEHGRPHFMPFMASTTPSSISKHSKCLKAICLCEHKDWSRSGAHNINKSFCGCGILMNSRDCLDWSSDMNVPKIKSVIPLKERHLLVTFVNGVQKVYDCQRILNLERFRLLKHEAFFKAVTVDPGGMAYPGMMKQI